MLTKLAAPFLDYYNHIMPSLQNLVDLLGSDPTSPAASTSLETILGTKTIPQPEPKVFPTGIYLNFYEAGLSLYCTLSKDHERQQLIEEIDIYNPLPAPAGSVSRRPSTKRSFAAFSHLPIEITSTFSLSKDTTGRDLVMALGEPCKKGGGVGWVDVWLEWEKYGVQFELVDPKGNEVVSEEQRKKGMGGIWDRAGGWRWGVLKIFKPTV